ncbi:MAG: hypothetical protein WBW87_12635 [Candidatus Cybelea sp.]
MAIGSRAPKLKIPWWLFVIALLIAVRVWNNYSRDASRPSGAAQANAACSDTDATAKRLGSALTAAKQSLANSHYAIAIRQSQAIGKTATTCINANDNADNFHYAHALAAFMESQARIASGDTAGISIFRGCDDRSTGTLRQIRARPQLAKDGDESRNHRARRDEGDSVVEAGAAD